MISPKPIDPGLDEKSIIKSVLKALSLLEAFSPETPEFTVAELAERTGIHKATCNRLMTTMMHAGWVQRVGGGRYAPTVKLFRIGSTSVGRLDVREAARPFLRALAARFGDTSYLMVPDGQRVVCLDRVEGDHPVKVTNFDIGMSLPYSLAAPPMAILAYREDLLARIDQKELLRHANRPDIGYEAFRQRLAAVRAQGYSLSLEDYQSGVAAVGAPVFDREGVAIASISLDGVTSRFQPPRRAEIIAAVVEAAARLSEQMGHSAPAAPASR
jgi:DNA-binding IclR family transcriptional regulator